MSPEAQRIAIAEVRGWRFEHVNKGSNYWAECIVAFSPDGQKHYGWDPKPPPFKSGKKLDDYNERKREVIRKLLPDYLGDLNAMHSVEVAHVLKERGDEYRNHLMAIRGIEWGHATASERAEALLRTLNLWRDE